MNISSLEELIQIEADQIAEELYGAEYFDLAPEVKLRVREHTIELLAPADVREGFLPAA